MEKKNKLLTVFIAIFIVCSALLVFIPWPKPDPEINECWAWAFGDDWRKVQEKGEELVSRWNERHGDIFIMHGTDDYYKTLDRVSEAYKKLN